MKEDNIINKKESGKMKIIIITLIILVIACFIYIRFIATNGFIVKEFGITSENLPANFNGFKIAHLSDIHYATVGKEKLDEIVEEVNKMKPDIVVFTGDLYDEFSNLTEDMKNKIVDSLSRIDAPLGKYAVSGNHDYSFDGFKELVERCGFIYLENESKLINYNGDEPIEIVGYPSINSGKQDYNHLVSNYFKIGLIHEGDALDNILDKKFDLVLAGHSHGGQVRFPFLGNVYKVEGGKKYFDEHYSINNTELYISYGLGESQYKIRSLNKPSFNFYRLYSKK